MNPIFTSNPEEEPLWDSFCVSKCDFRPHWNGVLVNLFTTLHPFESEVQTETNMKACASKIAQWVLDNKPKFSAEDRFQIIVKWPLSVRKSARQTIKVGGSYEDILLLANGENIEMMKSWSEEVFDL